MTKVNKTPNPVDLEKGEVNEVERALEELKQAISESLGKITCVNDANKLNFKLMDVRIVAQNLINILEAEKNKPKPMPKIDIIKINFTQDGNKICATLADFIDLQSSPAGFGDDREEALVGLIYDILKQKEK